MPIKIVKGQTETKYDVNQPIDSQIVNSDKIVVRFDRKAPELAQFLNSLAEVVENGFGAPIEIQVFHDNTIMGAQFKKKIEEIEKDIQINNLIRLMSLIYSETDRKLDDLSSLFSK